MVMATKSVLPTNTERTNQWRAFSSGDENPPAKVIVETAIDSLRDFAAKLRDVAVRIDQPHAVQTPLRTIQVSIAEAALHSRDATMDDFSTLLAETTRERLLQEAKKIEVSLAVLAEEYVTTIQPQMERATILCQETPCGGATWELDISSLQERAKEQGTFLGNGSGNQRVTLGGIQDTPCGRLQVQSMSFLETTWHTKQQALMASRCRILIELAVELRAPLRHIRTHGTAEQNQMIRSRFQAEVIPTPWIRTDLEYEELLNLKGHLKEK
jgi:hypothetical protein